MKATAAEERSSSVCLCAPSSLKHLPDGSSLKSG